MLADKKRIQVQIDKNLATETDQVLDKLGLTPTTLINMLYKRIVAEGKIPFEVSLTEDEKATIDILKYSESLPVKEFKNSKEIQEWLDDPDED